MAAQGTIVVRVFTSRAMLPIQGATVTMHRRLSSGASELLAVRLTNYDGLTAPVFVEAPEENGALLNENGQKPYSVVDLTVEYLGYDRIVVENAQIFAGIRTIQDFMLIPTPMLPEQYDRTETFVVPDQNL